MSSLERDDVVPALRAQACWAGVREPWDESLPRALAWLRLLWGEGDDHLPLTLVHDFGHVLLRGAATSVTSGRDLARWPRAERRLRLSYEDRVVTRWLMDPSVLEAHVAVAGLPPDVRVAAVAHAVGLALAEPLRAADLPTGNAAHLRAHEVALTAELPEPGGQWETEPEWRDAAGGWLEAAMRAAPGAPVFDDADLWELAHFADLPSESARIALRDLHAMRRRAGAVSPGVAGRVRRRAQEVPVEEETADSFPAGGFDAISQRGRFENLVRTEIVYVGVAASHTIDLFDLRHVQGELLYYTRDESPLLDARRTFSLVLDAPFVLREKHAALPTQTLVMAEGFALSLHADLARVFGAHSLTVHWRWCAREVDDLDVADEEQGLVGLVLAAEVAHGRADLSTIESTDALAHMPGVVFSPYAAPGVLRRRQPWLRIGEVVWRLYTPDGAEAAFDQRDPEAARALVDALLGLLVG